eukprot:NODE_14917_length_1078_cov_1.886435.p2 GENE.NODE_14917_length_1078_cov_1.886435~~NODE_14917_length_1078_cov_1.886435.p2  ORF type:complete len:105 (+),score=27.07 NODE_14917_length_1078_cov_1.886435:1-315(+)
MKTYRRSYCEIVGICSRVVFHDAHVVAFAVDPSIYTNVTKLAVEIVVTQDGQPENGMTYVDTRGGNYLNHAHFGSSTGSAATVLLGADEARFQHAFFEALARLP